MNSCLSIIKNSGDILSNLLFGILCNNTMCFFIMPKIIYTMSICNCQVTKYLEFPFFVQNVITKTSKDYYRILLQKIVAYNSPENTIMPFLLSR